MASASPPVHKRLKRFLRYLLIRGAAAVASSFPVRWVSGLGAWLGRVGFVVARAERHKALRHLELAFPEKSETERRTLARASFEHLGRCVGELVCARQIDQGLDEWVEWPTADRAVLDAALARGKGVLFISGHVGNWELTARGVTARGYDGSSIAREASDPRTTALIEELRASGNTGTIWRGQPGAAKAMLKQLRAGKILGLLIDQDTKVQSVFVPFFGRLAATPRAAADLALRTRAALIVGTCPRVAPFRYRLSLVEVPLPDGDTEADVVALTAALTRRLEDVIREYPAQWVWMHERWKRRPADEASPAGDVASRVTPATPQ
ncbi:MAG: lysophospholipid acyltransferase family protein [Myxococcaceae bacterium]|nr:lysophospholipid acyltransferase family protein [Myxococcaceae bacterium]